MHWNLILTYESQHLRMSQDFFIQGWQMLGFPQDQYGWSRPLPISKNILQFGGPIQVYLILE